MVSNFFRLKTYFLTSCLIIAGVSFSTAQLPYVTVWKTDNQGGYEQVSAPNQIEIPASGDFTYTWKEVTNLGNSGSGNGSGKTTITFPHIGTYRVNITPVGSNPFHRMTFNFRGDRKKLLRIEQWGDVVWSSFEDAYSGAELLTISADDLPDLTQVSSMERAFVATSFTLVPNMNWWDVSHVKNMEDLFSSNRNFNQPIGSWDVSNVTNMSRMFEGAFSFNQPIGGWDVRHVENMGGMFEGAYQFNQPIGDWNTGSVQNISSMFAFAFHFNQPIGGWKTSHVTGMADIFRWDTSFNQPLNDWDVSHVWDMSGIFFNASHFNQPLDRWDVSYALGMENIFTGATDFNRSLETWDISRVRRGFSFLNDIGLSLCGMSCENYSRTLQAWTRNPNVPPNLGVVAHGLHYNTDAIAARDSLAQMHNWIIVGDEQGCALSIAKVETPSITIAPNPVHDHMTLSGLQKNATGKLTDLTGRVLKTFRVCPPATSVHLDQLPAGVYILLIIPEHQELILTKKVLKL